MAPHHHSFSKGRGGNDLTICGCVEVHPGPRNSSNPFPEEYYLPTTTQHFKNRIRRCVVCLTVWSQALKKREEIYLPNNRKLLVRVQELLPGFSCDIVSAPLSVCLKCLAQTRVKQLFPNFQQSLSAAHQRIFKHTADRNPRTRDCNNNCPICLPCKCNPPTKKRNASCFNSATCPDLGLKEKTLRASTPVKTQISPFKRKYIKRLTPTTRTAPPAPPLISGLQQALVMQSDMGCSSRAMARGVQRTHSLQKKSASSSNEGACSTPSPSAVRLAGTKKNRAFSQDISAHPCDVSSDGAIYRVSDLSELLRKICWIRIKQVVSLFDVYTCHTHHGHTILFTTVCFSSTRSSDSLAN
jgi:hypothetical protein